jgi:hypothetical protein
MNIMNFVFNPKKHVIYEPVNKKKYKGDVFPCARSSWEQNFYRWCDFNESVTAWSVESLALEYFDPVKSKNRRYYPDVIMSVRDKSGKDRIYIVEIKPYSQVMPPKMVNTKKEKTKINEMKTYITNRAKWKAAELYCKKRGYIFKILTENDIFKDGKP